MKKDGQNEKDGRARELRGQWSGVVDLLMAITKDRERVRELVGAICTMYALH